MQRHLHLIEYFDFIIYSQKFLLGDAETFTPYHLLYVLYRAAHLHARRR